ncbi:hypothetical protein N7533_002325 [Penicillium manginii]|uniref:uncharacterized protein n=1 Tax=Penicillium manginii TaxID=203109 RepID=UPI002547B09A|nr:uncharacterized protein N7533_002325 [Penicillium manginii]KAJ5763644.1 hypothetical protein N7533_002325 [Penicillium manginii]
MSDPHSLIATSRFHQRVTLDSICGELTVSFADAGSSTGPALLFLPGMFASRYLGIPLHPLAERAGVRLLVVDRPGMGESTDVPTAQRIAAWTDLVPRLLAHLGIPRVSLVAHSAGTMYLLNTWAKCPELVNPALTFLAPWVDLEHSRVTTMQMARYVPTKAFTLWHHIPRFFVTQASPVLATSGALFNQLSSIGSDATAGTDNSPLSAEDQAIERDAGLSQKELAELFRLAVPLMFNENTTGANSEALQCLRKSDGQDWGACSDYAECVQTLAARESSAGTRVSVRAYFASSDAMVGERGKLYFEQCWQAPGLDAVDFVSETVEKTDHDTVMQLVKVWAKIFASVSGADGNNV